MDTSYMVAVVGGACAGSAITAELTDLGMDVIVIEQNHLPYGKIEDGLPRWHGKLQNKEMKTIDERMAHPKVHFVPACKLGEDLTLDQLRNDWGLPLVVMANGAWRDRPLWIEGVDQVRDDSFVYQNPLVYWFNHCHEPHFSGKSYKIQPGTVVIGGGLASVDVAKICQFELVRQALAERGHQVDLIEMEHHGIFKVLEHYGLTWDELGLQPARLFYRKRIADMPLVPLGDDATPEQYLKAESTREKIINNARNRYGFEVFPLHAPGKLDVEDGHVKGVSFQLNEFRNGRFVATGEEAYVATNMVISSIGSIPEQINGVPMVGELYDWNDYFTGGVKGHPGVYCVGNAITGRGNIKDSAKNAKRLAGLIRSGLSGEEPDYEALFKASRDEARAHVASLLAYLETMPVPDNQQRQAILDRVSARQQAAGFDGNYQSWRDQILAAR